jgi:lipid II:glycine glycyltransferase (peptidoglycan interpeptide bridge formation enzyme)
MTIHNHISEINKAHWDALVERSPTASFFQTRECYDFYASLSFLKPFVFGISENDKLVGILCGYCIADGNSIKRFFSRRAIAPGGLLLDTAISDEAIQSLLKLIVAEISHSAIYIEIRNFNDFSAFRSSIESSGFNYQPHLNLHVSTDTVDTVFSALSESKRRQIKSAQKFGVEWEETTNHQEVGVFYNKLKCLYDTKIKTPIFPLEFFEKLVKLPNGKLLVVKCKGEIIGGMACVSLDSKVLYEWFVCGDDTNNKDVFASVVATWAGIEFAAKNNFERFDFMGAGKPDKDYGVREFKSKFGGELVQHGRFLYICKPFLYFIGKKTISLLHTYAITHLHNK